jgi:acetyl esterase
VTLHPQAVAALELWAAGPSVTDPGLGQTDIEAMRADARAAAGQEHHEDVHRVEDVDANGVRCRLHVPTSDPSPGVLVFLHGGGFVFGDLDTHDPQARRLANRTRLAVLSVDYRRPPEHRFPAAPDDVDTALRWLWRAGESRGLDTGRMAVIGDSAGGNLALVAALRNLRRLSATVLVYPFLDPCTDHASYDAEDGGITRAEARWFWEQYAASQSDLADPDLAPLRSTRERLSQLREPVLILAAEHDVLVDENHDLARRLEEAEIDVRISTYSGMIHGFWRHPELFDAAEESLAEIAAFLAEHV